MDKGGLLISGHAGNWEIAGQLLVRLDKKINILMYDAEHQKIKGYLADVLQRNVHFIIIREDYSHLQEIKVAFSRGEIIAMHGDRYIEGNKTVVTKFLGKHAAFPLGPVNLAARFNVPAAYVFAVKETNTHYHFYSTPLQYIEFSNNLKKRDAILAAAVIKFVDAFETVVYKYPLNGLITMTSGNCLIRSISKHPDTVRPLLHLNNGKPYGNREQTKQEAFAYICKPLYKSLPGISSWIILSGFIPE